MAGDWIKMRCNLDTDWRVIQIASQLEMSELHVVGCLWKLWTWADQNTADGNAVSVTDVTLKALPEKRREEKIYTHTHTEENVPRKDLPEWVVDPWQRFLKTVFAVTGRQMPETTQDATLMEVLRRGEAKGTADLEFSVMKGAKTLLDSGNDFQARSVGSARPSASKSKSEAIKEFCK